MCSDVHGTQIVFFTPAGRALAAAPPLVVAQPLTAAAPLAAAAPLVVAPPAAETPAAADAGATSPTAASRSVGRPTRRRLFEHFMRELAERDVSPDWRTNLPRVRRDADIPWPLEAAAWEALEASAAGGAWLDRAG
ncbi:MAG: hypothetical protein HKN72_16690 [Gemmatimonadetes bacterium]|nr:hypothetical protein [Gemmatimonadota bacterium]